VARFENTEINNTHPRQPTESDAVRRGRHDSGGRLPQALIFQ
jgi:hypothetical protein